MALASGKDNKCIMPMLLKWESLRKPIWIVNFVPLSFFMWKTPRSEGKFQTSVYLMCNVQSFFFFFFFIFMCYHLGVCECVFIYIKCSAFTTLVMRGTAWDWCPHQNLSSHQLKHLLRKESALHTKKQVCCYWYLQFCLDFRVNSPFGKATKVFFFIEASWWLR